MDSPKTFIKKREETLDVETIVKGILKGERASLARAITLIESEKTSHRKIGQHLLKEILPYTGNSMRIGITGIPGAGKSTFIDKFGTLLIEKGYKVAVLTIDPTSPFSHGSILGDKTRMEELAKKEEAFIRPSPTGGHLGGVHRKTREAILICEAAGFDIIIIETVGVGQSETDIRSMTDITLLLTITGSGDDLQGMKKGIMETADLIIVTKADGENRINALKAKKELEQVLKIFPQQSESSLPKVYAASSLTGEGFEEIWEGIQVFFQQVKLEGEFFKRRQNQLKDWLQGSLKEQLLYSFYSVDDLQKEYERLEELVVSGKLPVTEASEQLLNHFFEAIQKRK